MGDIDTDPASSQAANQTVQAQTYYTAEMNGLHQPWTGNVWMNPPYSQPLINEFCETLALKFQRNEFEQAIVLANNATETAWFQTLLNNAEAICLPKSRIKFLTETGNPANTPIQGQTFFYFGPNKEKFKEIFKKFGGVLYVQRDPE
jgi:ParB family chromosome partitioning protein